MEKEKTLTVTLTEAQEWYKKGGELKELALTLFNDEELKKELPKTWKACFKTMYEGKGAEFINGLSEIKNISGIYSLDIVGDRKLLPIGMGKPMLALCQLLICREVYRDGWKPNWTDENLKYVIEYYGGDIQTIHYKRTSCILSFQSEELRNEFYKNFKDLIEEAKELI